MALPRERLSRRQKACLTLSFFLITLGLLLLIVGAFSSVKAKTRKCASVKGLLLGVYLVITGIFGTVGYFPRRVRNQCKQMATDVKRSTGARSAVAVFVVLSALIAVLVIMDSNSLQCAINAHSHSYEASTKLFTILGLVEVSVMHVAHLLCAVCVGLASPDLLFSSESSPRSSRNNKYKTSKQALHLPEARTHVQEVPGTGDKVTVVSLPQTDGIVYAVPEEQYVIRRGEATYMAPMGNTKLAAFFPTYTRVLAE